MIKKIKWIVASITALFFTQSSFAFFPVIDPTAIYNLVHQLETLNHQYTVMKQEYANAQERLSQAKELSSDSEGHYQFGDALNSDADMQNRQWSPSTWEDTLKGLSGGNPARYQELITQYKENHPTMSTQDYSLSESAGNAVIYQNQINNNQAASVTATYAFNSIKKSLDHIHELSEKIETAPNQKAAIDLNTRMETQIAYVQVQMLKQMALMNEQMAQNNADKIQYETQEAQFNRLPD